MTFEADALTRRLVDAWSAVDAGAVFQKSVDDARHLPAGVQRVLALLPVPAEVALTVVWLLLNIVFAYAFVTVLGVDKSERASAAVDFPASDEKLRSTSGEGDRHRKSGAGVREAPRLGTANPLVTVRTLYALFLGVLPVYVVFSGIFLKPFLFLILLSSVAVLYVPAGLMTGLAIAILSCNKKINDFRLQRAVVPPRYPTLSWIVTFAAYVVFFPGVLVGPAGGLRSFFDFLEGGIPPEVSRCRQIARIARAFACAGVYQLHEVFLPLNRSVLFDTLPQLSLPLRIVYITFAVDGFRYKYYLVWTLSHAASIAAGYATEGNGENLARNADILRVETATDMTDMTVGWNTSVSLWLKSAVFDRVMDTGSFSSSSAAGVSCRSSPRTKLLATLVTRLFSAVWHGFHVGYYLFFASTVLINASEGHPFLLLVKQKSKGLKWFLHTALFNTIAVSFCMAIHL
eukprot:g16631.t1